MSSFILNITCEHFFVDIRAFCSFSSNVPKREVFLFSHRVEFPHPGDTRWYYRACAIKVLHENHQILVEIFKNLLDNPVDWDDDILTRTFIGIHVMNY